MTINIVWIYLTLYGFSCRPETCAIYTCQLLKCIFKLIHKQLPHYFKQITFTFRNQQNNYATRTCQIVFIPNVDHEFAKSSIRFIDPAAYNSTHGNIIDKIYTHNFVGCCACRQERIISHLLAPNNPSPHRAISERIGRGFARVFGSAFVLLFY